MIRPIVLLTFFISMLMAEAQIGYQVAVMDQSTGKPKANTTVTVKLELTDSDGGTIATSSQSTTTNDFGVASVEIGSSSMFEKMDWSKLPLWISATVDGVGVGKTQVLSVPVAQHAAHYGSLTPKILASKTWSGTMNEGESIKVTFTSGGSGNRTWTDEYGSDSITGPYYIVGDMVTIKDEETATFLYIPAINALVDLRAHELLR